MQIYNRYNGDSSGERQRYQKRLAKSRHSIREYYDRLSRLCAALFIIFFVLVIALGIWGDGLPAAGVWVLASAAVLILIAAFIVYYFVREKIGDDEQTDLYIYGMEDGDFLLLNPLYEEMERISPRKVHEIRILAAMKPTSRQRFIGSDSGIGMFYQNGDRTHYEYFGETGEDGAVTPLPMAVLCTRAGDFDWRWIDDPIFRRDLQKWLTFVPFGENAQPFVQLLQNSSCPVVLVQEVYDAHWPALDALFRQSGMDLSRLQIMREESRQAQMTRII